MDERVGFIGLGIMGRAMALRLADAGTPLLVWNRSPEAAATLADAGADVAGSVAEVFAGCRIVVLMLRNEEVVDGILRETPETLSALVRGRTVVNMGTVSPAFSAALAAEVEAAGGEFVEAPVSGSRKPAENGELVAMTAGRPDALARVVPLLAPMCAQVTPCGPVPGGLAMKLAVNVFLISVVTGLAESFHFAEQHALDLERLREILDAGQMSSPISRVKTAKLVGDDLSPQAAISDVLMNAELVVSAARAAGISSPLLDVARDLYAEAVADGDGDIDMVGVTRAIARRDARDY
jgi:3-hydroxyisobutyrate dehydrogenase